MKAIKTFEELRERVSSRRGRPRIAAVCPNDEATRQALQRAEQEGLAEVLRFGDEHADAAAAAAEAVAAVRRGEADVLMKGLVGTDVLLRAVLDKQTGLLPAGEVLTHVAAAEVPTYGKLLLFTDAAVIPYPTHEQRCRQVAYAAETARRLGIGEPRVALIHCAEHGGKAFPFVDGYADICRQAAEGAFGPCVVDGPMDVKSACSLQALRAKGLTSPLEGAADVLVMPDIEAGNAFYKSLALFAHARTAGILCGTTAPVVVPSRGDNAEAKLNSLLLALATVERGEIKD